MEVEQPLMPLHFGGNINFSHHRHTCFWYCFIYVCLIIVAFGKLSDRLLLCVACCMYCLVSLFALVGSECVSFIFIYDVRKRRRYWRRSLLSLLFISRGEPRSLPRQAIPMLAVILLIIIYHACFTSESFPK